MYKSPTLPSKNTTFQERKDAHLERSLIDQGSLCHILNERCRSYVLEEVRGRKRDITWKVLRGNLDLISVSKGWYGFHRDKRREIQAEEIYGHVDKTQGKFKA